jgi:hypothetical protein
MGRRAHKPDPAQRRQVEAMAAYGIPEIDIAMGPAARSPIDPCRGRRSTGGDHRCTE